MHHTSLSHPNTQAKIETAIINCLCLAEEYEEKGIDSVRNRKGKEFLRIVAHPSKEIFAYDLDGNEVTEYISELIEHIERH
jgi:hypothetical protein